MTPDELAQAVADVRLLISDPVPGDGSAPLIPDYDVEAWLRIEHDVPRLAAAAILEAIAASEVLLSKKIRTQDLETDGPAVAAALRDLAGRYRSLAAAEDAASWDGFEVVGTVTDCTGVEHTSSAVWWL